MTTKKDEFRKYYYQVADDVGGANKVFNKAITTYSFDDILLTNIENALERNLLGRDEDSETIERIIELFKNSERTQLKWHFKQI